MTLIGIFMMVYGAVSLVIPYMFGDFDPDIAMIYLVLIGLGALLFVIGCIMGRSKKGERSEFVVWTQKDRYTLESIAGKVLKSEGYLPVDYHGEMVWKKGTGAMTAMQYIKLEYGQEQVIIYGWVQAGIGSVGGKEMGLEGFVGMLPKKMVKAVIEKLRIAITAGEISVASSSNATVCSGCGKPIDENAMFCTSCGKKCK